MTQEQRAKAVVDRMMHTAHLRYQRQQLRADHVDIAPSEVRGVREQRRASAEFKPEWFTHLRPNFWRGYFETLVDMSR